VIPDQKLVDVLFQGENAPELDEVHHQLSSHTDINEVYFRYDVRQLTSPGPLVQAANGWRKLLNNRDWDVVAAFRFLAKQYMDLPEQKSRILRCAELLQGPIFKIPSRFAVDTDERTRGSGTRS